MLSEHKPPPEVIESMLKAKVKYEPVDIYIRGQIVEKVRS